MAQACQRTCYQKNVMLACGCGDPHYPLNGTVFGNKLWPICSVSDAKQGSCWIFLYLDQTPHITSIFDKEVVGFFKIISLKNDTLKYLDDKVPFDMFQDNKYKDNLLTVEIYFEEFNFQVLSESPSYEVAQFLSDIGGILGLYLGMSFMSVVEFVELFIDFVLLLCQKCILVKTLRKRNNKIQRENNETHETVKTPNEPTQSQNLTKPLKTPKSTNSVRDLLLKF
ncbi:hypothetical protein HELRODRAFT_177243 [Helobdella robusta]|uniref:Uncharacterized protein n=1 Tax=Helobdella robusta TaxID=6412 RepID=T1FBE3_HELRO|nr:hypothetical protein HELRODRAFT_177243 [Helobdella robusta]ESN98359.1 hypothetical protein HELRODRAFT_177243 [Helobdella robusta]